MEDKDIMKSLLSIQRDLKAPKSQFNKFGNYKYRSAEDILEAVKPLCVQNNVVLTISDEIIQLGERIYVQSTAKISGKIGEYISVKAFAREEESKKGMDGAQITGSASSYARKYALNGLFCIDDTKDPDATNTYENNTQKEVKKPDNIDLELKEALTGIKRCKDMSSLEEVWNTFPGLWTNKAFVDEIKKKKNDYLPII